MSQVARIAAFVLGVTLLPRFALAQEAAPSITEIVSESAIDKRVREVAKELRCAVCQSESVADSNSTLARNMREIIRERVVAGDSPAEVKAYFVSRYGDYILMEPRTMGLNWALWLFPLVALFLGFLFIRARLQRSAPAGGTTAAGAPVDDRTQDLIAALREPAAEKDTENT